MVKIIHKKDAKWYVKPVLWFVPKDFYITIGKTIYCPNDVDIEEFKKTSSYRHELHHVKQYEKYWILYYPMYFLLPLPILFTFRYFFERVAFMEEIRAGDMSVGYVVNLLTVNYIFPWLPFLMRRWFERELAKEKAA